MELQLYKEDILRFGNTMFSANGFVAIVFDSDDSSIGVSQILIRNILRLFGEEYRILCVRDYELDSEGFTVLSLVIETNLPWELVENLRNVW